MKTYKLSFKGRKKGSIGIFYKIRATVIAESFAAAELKLYDNYEHISQLKEVK